MPAPGWTRDPGTLELVFHEAIKAGDMEGIDAVLRLLAVCDPNRAELLTDLMRIALAIAEPVEDDGWHVIPDECVPGCVHAAPPKL